MARTIVRAYISGATTEPFVTPRTDQAPSFEDSTATQVAAGSPPGRVLLRAEGAPCTPQRIALEGRPLVVGSGSNADLIVREKTVSRAHVEVSLQNGGVHVRDLESRNGTYYLGQRIQSMVLRPGARIVLGASVTLAFDAAPDDGVSPYTADHYRGLIGPSASMRALFGLMARLEGSLTTVLIEGESGAGKEEVARAIHEGSRVAKGPFVPVNCGAIARELVASELFGHRKGAFSGAVECRRGAFESANGGTLLLDEIGELPIEVQPMLLRALETGEIRAVGEDQPRMVKVRVLAATHRDLEERVRQGTFREDLFYRIAVVRLMVPPLRERREDIEPLAAKFAAAEGVASLPRPFLDDMLTRPFPGNVRELRNLVQAYVAVGSARPLGPGFSDDMRRACLKRAIDLDRPFLEQRDELVDEFTALYLDALLAKAGSNQTAAAAIASLDRTYLGRLLARAKHYAARKALNGR